MLSVLAELLEMFGVNVVCVGEYRGKKYIFINDNKIVWIPFSFGGSEVIVTNDVSVLDIAYRS